jgi:hypothetical protein
VLKSEFHRFQTVAVMSYSHKGKACFDSGYGKEALVDGAAGQLWSAGIFHRAIGEYRRITPDDRLSLAINVNRDTHYVNRPALFDLPA